MARVTLASLALVSLKLASRYRKEDPVVLREDASFLARTLLHRRRAAAMADDERATLSHRIREREVKSLAAYSGVSLCKERGVSLSFFLFLSTLDATSQFSISIFIVDIKLLRTHKFEIIGNLTLQYAISSFRIIYSRRSQLSEINYPIIHSA